MIQDLRSVIFFAQKLNWCMDYQCTTCGADRFRSKIRKLFNREQLIEQLKKLSIHFVDNTNNRDAMLILLDSLGYPNYANLIQDLSGTPAGDFLIRAITIEKERNANHRQRMHIQQENRKNSEMARAQANIWGAIKRKDFQAIDHLVAKGIDLNQTNIDGISIKEALTEIGL